MGTAILWGYALAPGEAGAAPRHWPTDSRLPRASDRATLVMLAHPQCPCTRASLRELAAIMTGGQGLVAAVVDVVHAEGAPLDQEESGLWRGVSMIPGVSLHRDEDGIEARRFGGLTSGQTALYDKDGRLLFSGGITLGRGHSGSNAGRSAILSFLTKGTAARAQTPVFGCPLLRQETAPAGRPEELTWW